MEPAAVSMAAQVPGAGYGGLEPLARQALQPRVSRTETAVTLNAQAGGRPGADNGASSTAPAAAQPESPDWRERAGDRPLQENPAYRPASFRRDSLQTAAQPAAPEPVGFDGKELRSAQVELRALRADVAELARALGRPLTSQSSLTEYRGVLQQFDELDSDVQLQRFNEDAQRELAPRAELQHAIREAEARQLMRKQEELLGALRRAERRLEEAPQQVLPPGLREAVIGEILRARYSAALFGGLGAVPLDNGRLAQARV